ncbi:hypothetical protein ACFOKI_04650 [Sphingomonas qilianensis]|uniref:Uncharacterized protein n=1 Tax=Sphingomonas qilianensis TaxID=1736690 RepID=A0ABU9XUH7_9SPHN
MTIHPETEEPGFESDVNEIPKARDAGRDDTLEQETTDQDTDELEAVQEEAAEERKEGGYQ